MKTVIWLITKYLPLQGRRVIYIQNRDYLWNCSYVFVVLQMDHKEVVLKVSTTLMVETVVKIGGLIKVAIDLWEFIIAERKNEK